jgi:arginine/ornithine N-succinyltransferase beta subunit
MTLTLLCKKQQQEYNIIRLVPFEALYVYNENTEICMKEKCFCNKSVYTFSNQLTVTSKTIYDSNGTSPFWDTTSHVYIKMLVNV